MDKLNIIIKNVFGVPETEIRDGLSAATIAEWDSMNYLLLIAEIEKTFSVEFSVDEVTRTQTLGDIKKYLRQKGVSL